MSDSQGGLAGARCLVTGATGFLGGYLVERLVDQQAQVRCLVRSTSKRSFLPDRNVEFIEGDVGDPASLPAAVRDCDYVFHVAALIKAPRVEDYYRVNYLGTINLLEACRSLDRLRRFVLISSLAAVGPSRPGRPVTESSLCLPTTPYGKSKWQSEQAVRALSHSLPTTIIRPPSIYGPRDRETLAIFQVANLGLKPRLPVQGEISLIHAADLVDGILLGATNPLAVDQTYFIANDEAPSYGEIWSSIQGSIGRRGIDVPVPRWSLRTAGRAAEFIRDVFGVPLIFDRHKADELASGYWACSNERARRELGFCPRIPLTEGFAETGQWYRKMGWLVG